MLDRQRQLTAAQKVSMESRIRSGVLPESALYEVEAQLARDEANIINAKGIYDVSVLTLKQLFQVPGDQALEIEIPVIDADAAGGIGSLTSTGIFE